MKDSLQKLYPAIAPFLPFLDDAIKIAELTTRHRLALFLANVAHESGGFKRVEENLNYSAVRLAQVWPNRFATKAVNAYKQLETAPNVRAREVANKPALIADIVYGGRYGNTLDGDGWRYRGRGLIMTTFKANYQKLDEEFGMHGKLVQFPDLLKEPEWAMKSAAAFWKRNSLNVQADKLDDVKKIVRESAMEEARRKIQGGVLGLADVKKHYALILKQL